MLESEFIKSMWYIPYILSPLIVSFFFAIIKKDDLFDFVVRFIFTALINAVIYTLVMKMVGQ